MANVWDEVDDLLDACEANLDLKAASLCAWSGELRIVLSNPDDGPSRSATFFAVGGLDPEWIAERLLADWRKWRAENPGIDLLLPQP